MTHSFGGNSHVLVGDRCYQNHGSYLIGLGAWSDQSGYLLWQKVVGKYSFELVSELCLAS